MERANRSVVHVRRKKTRLGELHIRPLVQLADGIGRLRGLAPGEVPYPDPDHGGAGAEVLFILTSPGSGATQGSGSGLLSLENDDDGAERCHREVSRVGLAWSQLVHWNLVPFPVRGRNPTAAEVRDGAYWIPALLTLLPEVRVVVLLGRLPETAWEEDDDLGRPGLTVIAGPSPGPQGIIQPGAPERLRSAFDQVAEALRQ